MSTEISAIEEALKKLGGHPRFYELLLQMATTYSEKDKDYDTKIDHTRNFTSVGMLGEHYKLLTKDREAFKTCTMWRFKQLDAALNLVAEGKEGKIESVSKRLLDDAIYCVLSIILYEEGK